MAANALVQTRIDEDVKIRAAAVLEKQGLTISDAVRILLTRTANEGVVALTPMSEEAYESWLRAKVQKAISDPRPAISREELDRRMAGRREAARARLI